MNLGEVRIADDQDFERLKKYCDNHDGWSIEYNHSPTTVWTKPTKDSCFHMIKVLTVYNDISGDVLYDVLHDPHFRQVWDKHMICTVDVGYLNPNNDVSYYAISCPPPLKNRDFVLQRSWLDTGRELYVLNHSVYHNQFPPKKGFVRGFSHLTGYLIRPLPSGGCSFSYVSHSDPRGKLPPWLVNRLTHVLAPKMIKSLHKACIDYLSWKPLNNPHFKPWIYPEQMTVPRISIQQCQKSPADDVHEEDEEKSDTCSVDLNINQNCSKKNNEKDLKKSKEKEPKKTIEKDSKKALGIELKKDSEKESKKANEKESKKTNEKDSKKKGEKEPKKSSEKELKKLSEKEIKKSKEMRKESSKKHR